MPRVTSPAVAVFDDYPDTVEMLVAALRSAGLDAAGAVVTSDDGAEVAPLIEQHRPSVVLYDVKPPYAWSVEKFRRLRQTFLNIPVLLTTTDGGGLRRWLRDGEVCGVFVKPCDPQSLIDAAHRALAAA